MLKHNKPNHKFINGKRYYRNTTSVLPGVSMLLSRLGLKPEFKGKSDPKNMERGTILHEIIEHYLLFPEMSVEDILRKNAAKIESNDQIFDYLPQISRLKTIISESITDVKLVEGAVWSSCYSFAGTVDCCAKWKGRLSIIDWKSGHTKFQDYYKYQLAAYAIAIEEMYELQISQGVNVIIRPYKIEVVKSSLRKHKRELIQVLSEF